MGIPLAVISHGLLGVGGTGTYPDPYDVRYGVDNGNGELGTLTSPSPSNVRDGIQYGGDGNQYTGTLAIPSNPAVPQTDIDNICQFEKHLEDGFAYILSGLAARVYDTATRNQDAVTPRIEVKAIIGSYIEHRHPFSNGGTPVSAYDVYNASIEVTIVTNRTVNDSTQDHRRLIGLVRSRMLLGHVIQNWQGNIIYPQDVRPVGTADTFTDEMDLDYTVMTHDIVMVVNPAAWPATLN